jgi:hypothetical protein
MEIANVRAHKIISDDFFNFQIRSNNTDLHLFIIQKQILFRF